MDTLDTSSLQNVDVTMVGGTMPGLMFYAGFMEEISKYQWLIHIQNVSGTSAGAAIGALTAVGKAQLAPELLINAFKGTWVYPPWYLRALLGSKNGIFGKRTIQGTLKEIIQEHVHPDTLVNSPIGLKTLHMRLKKGKLMSATENLPNPYKEVVWLIQNLIKYAFGKITWNYGKHEVFDSRKVGNKDKVLELISGSFQYAPENASEQWEMLTDGEMWSWHESSGTVTLLNQDISPDSNLLVLTRFQEGHESHTAVQKQIDQVKAKAKKIISPIEPLKWDLVSTDTNDIQHNLEIWRKTARMYILAQSLKGSDEKNLTTTIAA